MAHITDIIIELMLTALKLLDIHIADNTGNIKRADESKEPTRFIANTTTNPVIIERKVLQ